MENSMVSLSPLPDQSVERDGPPIVCGGGVSWEPKWSRKANPCRWPTV